MNNSSKPQIELIPAIDIINGQIVRLTQGDYSTKKIYGNAPSDFAQQIEELGYKRIHIVDLEGAKCNQIVNHAVLESIANKTKLVIDFGGGLKSKESVKEAFDCGAHYVTLGSIAAKNPELSQDIISQFGADRIILGADTLNNNIRINGWQENANINVFDFIKEYTHLGVKKILCTDISKDGMLKGPSIDLYKEIMKEFPQINLIASGGISSINDIQMLEDFRIPSVVFGKAIYENKINLKDLAVWAKLSE